MGVDAVGGYLRTLREGQKLTMAFVASRAAVSPNYVWRVETADIKEPSATNIAALTAAVHGNPKHVHQLLLDHDITTENGVWLAEQYMRDDPAFGNLMAATFQLPPHTPTAPMPVIPNNPDSDLDTIIRELHINPSFFAVALTIFKRLIQKPD